MKNIILVLALFSFALQTQAQRKILKIEMNAGTVNSYGMLADNDIINPDAYFAPYGFQTDLTIRKYNSSGFGFGLRIVATEFSVDEDMFALNLLTKLGSNDISNYSISDYYVSNTGIQLALSYDINIGKKFSIEPFVNSGLEFFATPEIELFYLKNGASFQFKQKEMLTTGISLNPGLILHYRLNTIMGLQVYGSYTTIFADKTDLEQVDIGANSINKSVVEHTPKPEFATFGVGLTISLVKKKKSE